MEGVDRVCEAKEIALCVKRRVDGDLDGSASRVVDELESLHESLKRELVGAKVVHGHVAALDELDGLGPAVRTKVSTEEGESLVVRDDGPVASDGVLEDGVLEEGAEATKHGKTLGDGRRVTRGLDVDIAAIALGELHDLGEGILVLDVDGVVSTHLLGGFELVVVHVKSNDLESTLGSSALDTAETERTATTVSSSRSVICCDHQEQ